MQLDPAIQALLKSDTTGRVIAPNHVSFIPTDLVETQAQTAQAFSDKWDEYEYGSEAFDTFVAFQKQWYLQLYGFADEAELAAYLKNCPAILDAGAGKCYKAAWFAELSPDSVVVAADISGSLDRAAEHYAPLKNLYFVQCDIGSMPFFRDSAFDYVSCDQVLHHTTDPAATTTELARVLGPGRELALYVYRKKALPRELVDDYFRDFSATMSHEELLAFSRQLTELGKILSRIEGEIDVPAIPVLGIEGGKTSVQRFIYWNFLKCFWNEDHGEQNSVMVNYDWYSPSQAFRYSEEEFRAMIGDNALDEVFFHAEKACYSGRFSKKP